MTDAFKPDTGQRPVRLLQPSWISFGVGVARDCAGWLKERGCGRVVLFASGSALAASGDFTDGLTAARLEVVLKKGIPAEPGMSVVSSLITELDGTEIDAVVALGGGSVLDVAKVFAALHGRARDVSSILGRDRVPPRRLPLVCLPTTAGAGSEASPNAILLNESTGRKEAAISPYLVPDATFVDPSLAVGLPPELTASTGMDALCHCLEAFTNRNAHPIVDHYALEGVRLIAAHLEEAVRNGANLEARSALALGSLYGGLCLGPVNTAAVHALSYPLGTRFGLPHGLANALLLPHVFAFNLSAVPKKSAQIARALGVRLEGSDEAVAAEGAKRLHALAESCGIPPDLSKHGVSVSDTDLLASEAMQVQRLLANNPRPVSIDDARSIYLQALQS
jgi:alcohol dehydrogenase class IV